MSVARYVEPFLLLVAQLGRDSPDGPALAYRFNRFRPRRAGLNGKHQGLPPPSASRPGDDGVSLSILLVFSLPLLHMITGSQAAALSETVLSIESGGTLE